MNSPGSVLGVSYYVLWLVALIIRPVHHGKQVLQQQARLDPGEALELDTELCLSKDPLI